MTRTDIKAPRSSRSAFSTTKASPTHSGASLKFQRGAVTGKWSLFRVALSGSQEWVVTDTLPELWKVASKIGIVGDKTHPNCPLVTLTIPLPTEN